jgi:hypothetical protein
MVEGVVEAVVDTVAVGAGVAGGAVVDNFDLVQSFNSSVHLHY